LLAACSKAASKNESKQVQLQQQIEQAGNANSWRQRAQALQEILQQSAGKEVSLELLDESKSPEENIQLCLKQAEKIERTISRCAGLLQSTEAEATRWRTAEAKLQHLQQEGHQDDDSSAFLVDLEKQLLDSGWIKQTRQKKVEVSNAPPRRKY